MIRPIAIETDAGIIIPGYLVYEHWAIYSNKGKFLLLKVKYSTDDVYLQDGPHVQLLKSQEPQDIMGTIQKIMSVLQEKSAWWFITEVLDLSQEINFDLEETEKWN